MKWANPPAHFRRPRSAVALDMIRPGSNFVPGGQHVHALVIILPGASTAARSADLYGIYPVRIGPSHRHWLSSESGQSGFRAWRAGSRREWRRTMFSPRSTKARAPSRDIVRPPRRGSVRAYAPVWPQLAARGAQGGNTLTFRARAGAHLTFRNIPEQRIFSRISRSQAVSRTLLFKFRAQSSRPNSGSITGYAER